MKKVLTIAGSDCSGGAGIQADLKTIAAHGLYGMSVITALTAQNTTGVYGVQEAAPEFVASQLDCVFTDIRPDAVKIGMVANKEIIHIIAEKLKEYRAENIVADPVMVSTSGSRLMLPDAVHTLRTELLPLSDVLTPNIPEAEVLAEMPVTSLEEMAAAAERIRCFTGRAVLVKGGHLQACADDLLCMESGLFWYPSERVNNPNTHGTGCTLSSAVACNLAVGHTMEDSIRFAKEYITGALKDGLDLGAGSGPLNHCYNFVGKTTD